MFVYVVYQIIESSLDVVMVFEHHDDAKWFIDHTEGEFKIWQRPLIHKIEYVDGKMTMQYTK